jgi:hypothetical protein
MTIRQANEMLNEVERQLSEDFPSADFTFGLIQLAMTPAKLLRSKCATAVTVGWLPPFPFPRRRQRRNCLLRFSASD